MSDSNPPSVKLEDETPSSPELQGDINADKSDSHELSNTEIVEDSNVDHESQDDVISDRSVDNSQYSSFENGTSETNRFTIDNESVDNQLEKGELSYDTDGQNLDHTSNLSEDGTPHRLGTVNAVDENEEAVETTPKLEHSLSSQSSVSSGGGSTRSKKKGKVPVGTSENPIDVTDVVVDHGSLLELYQNDYFDAHMHMYHLYHKKEPGVHEYLVNMLYTKRNNDEISFYLPQLCQLAITKYGKSSLHRFLLDRASGSMHFALQLSWFYQAVLDDQMSKHDRLSQKITQETEMAVVNCKLITPSNFVRTQTDAERLASPNLLDRRLFIKSLNRDVYTDVNSLLVPQMPNSLVHNTFTLSCPNSKVKLKGVHTRLGNPLNLETHPLFDCNDDVFLELQRLMMKQRRLNYFNLLNNFVSLSMEVSMLLTTEPKRDAREPLLRVFASALNEWMLLRRCTVAAYEESFSYTGLSIPLKSISHLNDKTAFQMLRIVENEIKVFFSRKRAPFVFYIEFANLDEDVEAAKEMDKGLTAKNFYVFNSIVQDLLNYEILTPTHIATIKDPLECIRYALGMLPPEKMTAYDDAVLARDEESAQSEIASNGGGNEDEDDKDDGSDGELRRSSSCTQSFTTNKTMLNARTHSTSSKHRGLKDLTPEETRAVIWPETFETKRERIRKASPYGHLKSWQLCAFVIKGGDDLRQENMGHQILRLFSKIFRKAKLPLWLRPIDILVTGSSSGIMEFVHDTCSVDVIKRRFNAESIATVFEKLFADNIYEARKNFIESHAAYSLVSYLLHVKDKHNGNIMLDSKGHAIHIDYGYCLTNSPGNINFEATSFKLTNEYMDVIGGESSDNFAYFRTLVINGLLEARKHVDQIVLLVEMMTSASKMPCFVAGTMYTIEALKDRFMLNLSEETCRRKINEMIYASINNFRAVQYDNFQRLTNGIM
ncbi:phosphatidylinositol 4-kinase family protein [Theileria equi strain WA]|uniref:1-phosphatidylinositol 4-kinase n=1 Tax=Theileria equi strain WA TaxID=1537102 RepID=L1LEP4_THEEQ|nr:phosphatidylinositol 4-kinase family protein [Theileria equi strain WA]EKX73907.1 phosphatidylinositol 4-kinase family protein [Theileria equi strain WA]|eukprot:XP_004833359.1 phosphatidylinositol 4-kinase family protein [Theileria equi strain WA]